MNKIAKALGLTDDQLEDTVFDYDPKFIDRFGLYKHDKEMSTYYCHRSDCLRSMYRNKGSVMYGTDKGKWEEVELTEFEKENYRKEAMIEQLKLKHLRKRL